MSSVHFIKGSLIYLLLISIYVLLSTARTLS